MVPRWGESCGTRSALRAGRQNPCLRLSQPGRSPTWWGRRGTFNLSYRQGEREMSKTDGWDRSEGILLLSDRPWFSTSSPGHTGRLCLLYLVHTSQRPQTKGLELCVHSELTPMSPPPLTAASQMEGEWERGHLRTNLTAAENGLGARLHSNPGSTNWLAVCPWANWLTSLGLNSLVCKMGIMIIILSSKCCDYSFTE